MTLMVAGCKDETEAFIEEASEVICSCVSDGNARETCEVDHRAGISESLLSCDYESSGLEDCLYSLEQRAESVVARGEEGKKCWTYLGDVNPGVPEGDIRNYCPGICEIEE